MAAFGFLLLACVVTSCYGIVNGRQSAFRQQMASKLPKAEDDEASVARDRWLNNYYQSANFKHIPAAVPAYEMTSPDEFEWLTEEHSMHRQPEEKAIPYSVDTVKSQNLEELLGNLYDNDDLDYSDFYNIASLVNGQIPLDPSFQNALREYLMEQTHSEKIDSMKKTEQDQFPLEEKKKDVGLEMKTEISSSSTTVSTPVSQESVSKTTDTPIPSTKPSDGLNVLPPVHLGKGQKEYPMLRPASENGRKFDNWSEKFQKPMISAALQQNVTPNKDDYTVDQASEDLDQLKVRSRRSAKLPPSFF